jgi:hypothetical protein
MATSCAGGERVVFAGHGRGVLAGESLECRSQFRVGSEDLFDQGPVGVVAVDLDAAEAVRRVPGNRAPGSEMRRTRPHVARRNLRRAVSIPAAATTGIPRPASRKCSLTPSRVVKSDRPAHGYRVSRLARDCLELLDHLGLEDAVLLGHSAGCVVLWSFLDLFGQDRVRGLVLCDRPIAFIKRPEWTER